MKDIDEIRRDNLRILESEFGSPTSAAKRAGMTLAQFSNLRDGAKDSKTGKPRGMRKETARKIEESCGKHEMWLDIDHSSNDAGSRILSIFNQLSPSKKDAAEQSLLGLLALENLERAKKPGAP